MGWSKKYNQCVADLGNLRKQNDQQILAMTKLNGQIQSLKEVRNELRKDIKNCETKHTRYIDKVSIERTELKDETDVLVKLNTEYEKREKSFTETIEMIAKREGELDDKLELEINKKKLYRYTTWLLMCSVTAIVLVLIFG